MRPRASDLRLDLLRREPGLLRPQQELADLVREPSQGEEVAVRGPLGGVLPLEQVLDERELIGGREHLRRLCVPERGEPLAEDQMAQTVEGQDLEAGERRGEACDQRVARGLPRAARSHHQRHALRVGPVFHERREPFAKHRGLPCPGGTGDQERTGPVGQDVFLKPIEGEGGVHKAGCYRQSPTPPRSGRGGTAPVSSGAGVPRIRR